MARVLKQDKGMDKCMVCALPDVSFPWDRLCKISASQPGIRQPVDQGLVISQFVDQATRDWGFGEGHSAG